MFVLDTDVVSELRKTKAGKGNPNVAAWVESVEPVETFLSSITVHELELGILLLERKDPKQGAILRVWLDTRVLSEFDERILAVDLAVGAIARRCRDPVYRRPRRGGDLPRCRRSRPDRRRLTGSARPRGGREVVRGGERVWPTAFGEGTAWAGGRHYLRRHGHNRSITHPAPSRR